MQVILTDQKRWGSFSGSSIFERQIQKGRKLILQVLGNLHTESTVAIGGNYFCQGENELPVCSSQESILALALSLLLASFLLSID
jgi:hypothetical protein